MEAVTQALLHMTLRSLRPVTTVTSQESDSSTRLLGAPGASGMYETYKNGCGTKEFFAYNTSEVNESGT